MSAICRRASADFSSPCRHGMRGFTLMELLVAVSLAAGVAMLGMMLMRTMLTVDERWTARKSEHTALRDTLLLLEHYWKTQSALDYDAEKRLLRFALKTVAKTPGTTEQAGFACEATGERFSLVSYRWSTPPAPAASPTRDGAETPLAEAREILLDGLLACGFGFLQPPPAGDAEKPARWVEEWRGIVRPRLIRLDLATGRGALPPLIPVAEPL